ncbi:MAG: hypothetical protein ACXW1F_07145 [Halobacteriota archaeon]
MKLHITIMSLLMANIGFLTYAQAESRCTTRVSPSLVGRWQEYGRAPLDFFNITDWRETKTIYEFRTDGTLSYYNKENGKETDVLTYELLGQWDNSLEILIRKPSTNGQHIKKLNFSDGCKTILSESFYEITNARTKKDKVIGIKGKLGYIGNPSR